jgi:VIT1/CCC1 family predicted Fe2+/Mn2+ transporter
VDQSEQENDPVEEPQTAEESLQPASAPEAQLPPEARGAVNGGPLGCCFGLSMGLLLSAGLASLSIPVLSHFFASRGWLALTTQIVAIVLAIAIFFMLGYTGWKIGRRIFREYEPSPGQLRKMARLQQRQVALRARKHR